MSVQNSHVLKQLETRLSKLRAECDVKKKGVSEADQEYQAALSKVRAVEREIEDLRSSVKDPVVTEHALLRYLERVHGIDLEAIRREMVSPEVAAQIRTLKSCRLPIADGVCLVVEDLTVRTVETTQRRDKSAKRSGRMRPAQFRALQAEEQGLR